jgi:hypothetical protein
MGVVLTTNSHLHAEIKERIEPYLDSLSGPSRPVLGRNVWLYNYTDLKSETDIN